MKGNAINMCIFFYKILSTFPFNLEKKTVWENRFSALISSFFTSEIVTCGI